MSEFAEFAEYLTDDGDTVNLSEYEGFADDDTRVLRLSFTPDDHMTIMDEQGDGVWCGRLEWGQGPQSRRPEGFTGRAEIIHRDRDDRLWWQIPDDITPGSEACDKLRQTIRDLIEYGYSTITVELLDGADAYGRPIVRKVASLSGIEAFPDAEYVKEVVGELLTEIEQQP